MTEMAVFNMASQIETNTDSIVAQTYSILPKEALGQIYWDTAMFILLFSTSMNMHQFRLVSIRFFNFNFEDVVLEGLYKRQVCF